MALDKKTIRSIIGGHKAHRVGKDFEAAMQITNRAYDEHGLARITKLPVPTVYVGNGMRRLCATQTWDYDGSFGPNAGPIGHEGMYYGIRIAMEAKANSLPKTSMVISSSTGSGGGISYHQLEALASAARDWGVVAAVVWMNGPNDLMVLLPDDVRRAKKMFDAGERKSIPVSMFTKSEVASYPGHPHVFDWLYEVRCWLEHNGLPSPASSSRRVYDMVAYGLDISRKIISVDDPDAESGKRSFSTVTTDRVFLDQIARESSTTEEFEKKVGDVTNANERGPRQQ